MSKRLTQAELAEIRDGWSKDTPGDQVLILLDHIAALEADLANARSGAQVIGLPTSAGHYWAKWRTASDGTREAEELTPSDTWEIVQVFVNCLEETDPEHLMVHVPGVERAQPLDGFVWGEGPIKRTLASA